jgi:hypothetical protein
MLSEVQPVRTEAVPLEAVTVDYLALINQETTVRAMETPETVREAIRESILEAAWETRQRIEAAREAEALAVSRHCPHCGGPVNGWGECLEEIWNYTYRH